MIVVFVTASLYLYYVFCTTCNSPSSVPTSYH